ncbi:MAG: hypothetical protein ACP5UZ_02595, partial [Thermoplasmata archaeon]
MLPKKVIAIAVLTVVILSSATVVSTAMRESTVTNAVQQNPISLAAPEGAFAFLSEFTSGGNFSDYGWSMISGSSSPVIVKSTNYYGEPSIALTAGTALYSQKGIVRGDKSLSFQFAVNAADGNGTFLITNSTGEDIASISADWNTVSVNSPGMSSPFIGNITMNSNSNGWIL